MPDTTMSVQTAQPQQETLLQLLQAGRAYDFLTLAEEHLVRCPDDSSVRLLAIREYVRLNLVLPARALLTSDQWDDAARVDLETVRTAIDQLRSYPEPWSSRTRCFERNLQALASRGMDTTVLRRCWEQEHVRYQLFQDSAGFIQVRRRDESDKWRWLPRLGDHRALADAQSLAHRPTDPTPGPYVFEGLDLGFLLDRVYRETRHTFHGFSCALFVLEPVADRLAIVLHLHDWEALLSDRRVFLFVGPHCADEFRKTLQEDRNLPYPRQAFHANGSSDGSGASAVRIVEEAGLQREVEIGESLAALERQYAARDAPYWADRFDEALSGGGRPLRILAAVSMHTTFLKYSMRDAKRSFESLGHSCRVLTEGAAHEIIGPLTYHDAIRRFDPDLFFNIDHLRPEFEGILPANLPLLTWDQDQLPQVFTPENIKRIGPLDFVVGWSKPRCVGAGADPAQFLYAGVPTCPEQFSGGPLSEDETRRYACDVSYVSHASQTPRAFHEEERGGYSDTSIRGFFDNLYEIAIGALKAFPIMSGALAQQLIEEASRQCGLRVTNATFRGRLIDWYLWRLGDRVFRHEALEWVAAWAERCGRSFRIYGNGWDKHPTLARYAAGPAEHGRDLLCIYRASEINLQLMPAGFVHQRALDGLAAGGFFLSRSTPGDTRGLTLRRIDDRLTELEITHTRELLDSPDTTLHALLEEFFADQPKRIDPNTNELYVNLRTTAELMHPQEVFPRFDEILFSSADEFAEKADGFLRDDDARRAIAAEMRSAVVEHYSYRPTMDRFLRAMGDFLRASCA